MSEPYKNPATRLREPRLPIDMVHRQYGVEYAEAFHYIAPGAAGADRDPRIDSYLKEHAVPAK